MIELRELTKSFRTVHGRHFVFRDLSLTFPDDANIGLIGPNGAGKSTLMRLIGGIDAPDRGSVVTNKRISFPVGLSGGFQGTLSGRDNAKFVCRLYGAHAQEVRDKVRFVEEFAELGKYFDMPIKTYSSGMRSRLIFGLSMAFDFDYYLLDEVGAVGDAGFKEKSRELLETKIGKANVICVSHNMNVIREQCTVVVLLQGGEARFYDDLEEGIRAYQGEAYTSPARRRKRLRPVRLDTISPRDVRRARKILRVVRKARRSAIEAMTVEPTAVAASAAVLPDAASDLGNTAAGEISLADIRLIGHGQRRSAPAAARRKKRSRSGPSRDGSGSNAAGVRPLESGNAAPGRNRTGEIHSTAERETVSAGELPAAVGTEGAPAPMPTVRSILRQAKRAARLAAKESRAAEVGGVISVAAMPGTEDTAIANRSAATAGVASAEGGSSPLAGTTGGAKVRQACLQD